MPKIVVNGQSVEAAIAGVASAGSIPIGGIIPWMAPTVGAPQPAAPTGFEYCDGTVVATAGPMFGLTKPTLMRTVAAPGVTQRMVRGGNTSVAYGGATALVLGGADTHTHTGATGSAGSHNHNVNGHTHPIASDGLHNHGVFTGAANIIGGGGSPYGGAVSYHNHDIATDGGHTHGGNTSSGTSATDFAAAHTHTLSPNSSANIPSYVELAWIIRCV